VWCLKEKPPRQGLWLLLLLVPIRTALLLALVRGDLFTLALFARTHVSPLSGR